MKSGKPGQGQPLISAADVLPSLERTQPAWLLDERGVVRATNALAAWLWNLSPLDVLGKCAADIFAENINRIPTDANKQFLRKKAAVFKRLSRIEAFGEPMLYRSFERVMEADPARDELYAWAFDLSEQEFSELRWWTYSLSILAPGDGGKQLQFAGTVSLLGDGSDMIGELSPTDDWTRNICEATRKKAADTSYVVGNYPGRPLPHAVPMSQQVVWRLARLRRPIERAATPKSWRAASNELPPAVKIHGFDSEDADVARVGALYGEELAVQYRRSEREALEADRHRAEQAQATS